VWPVGRLGIRVQPFDAIEALSLSVGKKVLCNQHGKTDS